MTPSALESPVDAGAVRTEALSWPDRAKQTTVRDSITYNDACTLLKGIKALRLRIAETFDPHISRAFQAHRALTKEKADAEAPLSEAEAILKRAMVAYDDAQERLRREEETRLREQARLDDERRQLEEAAALELEADRTGDAALRDVAEQLLVAPVPTPVVIAPKTTPKVAGITFRETWSARVVNVKALIAHIAAHPECANYVTPNLTALNAAVRAQRHGFQVPGVEAVCQKSAAAGVR
jgi:hypothetical protein